MMLLKKKQAKGKREDSSRTLLKKPKATPANDIKEINDLIRRVSKVRSRDFQNITADDIPYSNEASETKTEKDFAQPEGCAARRRRQASPREVLAELGRFEPFADHSDARRKISPVKSKLPGAQSPESSFSPTPRKRQASFQEPASDYIDRSMHRKLARKRTSQLSKQTSRGKKQFFIKKYDTEKERARAKSRECVTDDSHECAKQGRCLEHFKELDMVCEEAGCRVAVCSSCILFGQHKNHQYTQVENFLENVASVRANLEGVRAEVRRSKKALARAHEAPALVARVSEKRRSLEAALDAHCDKIVRRVHKKREEVASELKYHFKGLKARLGKFCEEGKDLLTSNRDWEDLLAELLRGLEGDPRSVESSFRFLGQVNEKKMFFFGQRLLDTFGEMQRVLAQKVRECVDSFSVGLGEAEGPFFSVSKREVDFESDLREKFRTLGGAEAQNLNIHEMNVRSGPLDEECFLEDNLDPLSTNLMSSLNLLNEKVKNHKFDFSNREHSAAKQEPKKQTSTFDARFPLQERHKNVAFKGSKTEVSSVLRDTGHHKQNLLSSANMDADLAKRRSRHKASKSNKMFKVKSYHKKSQGGLTRLDFAAQGKEAAPAAPGLAGVEQLGHSVHVQPQQHALRPGHAGVRAAARAGARHERDPVEPAADEHQVPGLVGRGHVAR